MNEEILWWRTIPVATKTRYHSTRGALLRGRIYPLIFIFYYELLTRTCLSGSSLISSIPFRLPGGFFPFQDPIREAHPSLWTLFLSMSMLGVGCGPQVGPFPSRPVMGSIRGEGSPPQTLAVIWEKKGVSSISSGCSRKAGEGVQPPSPPPPPPLHASVSPPRRLPPLLAPATGSSPPSSRRRRSQATATSGPSCRHPLLQLLLSLQLR